MTLAIYETGYPNLTITEDEALVLGEYFNRFDDTGDLSFRHPAEYLALQRIAGQIVPSVQLGR